MIYLQFTIAEFDRARRKWDETVEAELVADGDQYEVLGNAEWVDLELGVIDPDTSERVTLADGAERWARLLPSAFRSGSPEVKVVEDSETDATGVTAQVEFPLAHTMFKTGRHHH